VPLEEDVAPTKPTEEPQTDVIIDDSEVKQNVPEPQTPAPTVTETPRVKPQEQPQPEVKEPRPAVKEPEPAKKEPEPQLETPKNNTEDDIQVEFNDDAPTSNSGNSNNGNDTPLQNGSELEDEYYDLDGF